jgi:hypothetical protein
MKTGRDFLVRMTAVAASLTSGSGQTAAQPGLSSLDETGRKEMESNDLLQGDEDSRISP